jgi:hypothetical protein
VDSVRDAYLKAAGYALGLLRHPAVAAGWDDQSALAEMTVGALAGHLGRQIFTVRQQLDVPAKAEAPISLLDHYARSAWVDAALDDEPNVAVRRGSELESVDGPDALAGRAAAAVAELRARLPAEPADRAVFLPWGPWSLTLDDMLRTRMMEIVVHGDDLACGIGLDQAQPPEAAADIAVELLTRLALRKHGPAALVRALSRAERAPASITAF